MRTSPSRPAPTPVPKARPIGRIAAAGATLLACGFMASTASAATLSTTLTYTCKFPVVAGTTTVTADVTTDIPDFVQRGVANPAFHVTANASIPGIGPAVKALAATTIEGAVDPQDPSTPDDDVRAGGTAAATISIPGQPAIPVVVSLGIDKQPLSNFTTAVQHVVAAGLTPALEFDNSGVGSITLQSLDLNVELRKSDGTPVVVTGTKLPDSDGDPNTFDILCTQDDPDHLLGKFTIGQVGVPVPSPTPSPLPTVTPIPTPLPTPQGDPTPIPTKTPLPTLFPTRTPTPTPLGTITPKPTPLPSKTPTPTPVGLPTPVVTKTPTPVGTTIVDYPYSIKGSAGLKNLVKGALPLTGSIDAHLNLSTFAYTAQLKLNETTGNLTALGFLPVTATVDIVPTQDVTGTLIDSKLQAQAKVRIKLPKISSFGLQLAGGASCQTTQISTINLASTQLAFDPFVGGPIAGSFSISNLAGCGVLNGIVSPLTAGSGNTILLNLTPTNS